MDFADEFLTIYYNIKKNKKLYLFNEFQKNSDSILDCLTIYLEKYNILPNNQEELKVPCKDNNLSQIYREEGNNSYKKTEWMQALEMYNKSIAFAEVDSSSTECLALGFGNRSAVLYKLNYMKECLEDIERALKLDYPIEKRAILENRRNRAIAALNQAKPWKCFNEIPEDVIKNKNTTIKCASNKVEFKYNEKYGRHVVATDHIELDEIIAVEKPYVAVLSNEFCYRSCSYCFNFAPTLISCNRCPYALFCNEQCRREAETYHKYECKLHNYLMKFGSSLMGNEKMLLRIACKSKDSMNDAIELLNRPNNPNDFGYILSDNGQKVFDTNYTAIYNFDENRLKEVPIDIKVLHCYFAVMLLNLLKRTDYFDDLDWTIVADKSTRISVTMNLLLRHILTFADSIYAIAPTPKDNTVPASVIIGKNAIYPFFRLLNHSCDPNVFYANHGTKLIVRAWKPIRKGEQLFRHYGFCYHDQEVIIRKMQIATQYNFQCDCQACVENWPTRERMLGSFKFHQMHQYPHEMTAAIEFLAILERKFKQGRYSVEFRREVEANLSKIKYYVIALRQYVPCWVLVDMQKLIFMYRRFEGNIIF